MRPSRPPSPARRRSSPRSSRRCWPPAMKRPGKKGASPRQAHGRPRTRSRACDTTFRVEIRHAGKSPPLCLKEPRFCYATSRNPVEHVPRTCASLLARVQRVRLPFKRIPSLPSSKSSKSSTKSPKPQRAHTRTRTRIMQKKFVKCCYFCYFDASNPYFQRRCASSISRKFCYSTATFATSLRSCSRENSLTSLQSCAKRSVPFRGDNARQVALSPTHRPTFATYATFATSRVLRPT